MGKIKSKGYLQTGQRTCHDASGRAIGCPGSGQDAEFQRGEPWPTQRFTEMTATVRDNLTGLEWTMDANPAEFPMPWQDALDYIKTMNHENAFGQDDWRLPNRRELRSLMSYQARKTALPGGHPFKNVFQNWYWTSTTAAINTAYAWYVHMEGARMFYGRKEQFYLVWPVRGVSGLIPATGQHLCFDAKGSVIPCAGTGQDGELRLGIKWPDQRFRILGDIVRDNLTGLCWHKTADITGRMVNWEEALKSIDGLNKKAEGTHWRLPNINELESLVDCSTHSPALSAGYPFIALKEAYWSSTTSLFEPDWAWALYLMKGAVGVGMKSGPHFHVWPVRDEL
ncbi:MAG: DUF1566 domain-containing protein [Nitrospirota bacterium]|nr:DUF1566 domain-containing protein [Nitrospirota bacterium]